MTLPNEALVVRGGKPSARKILDSSTEYRGLYGFSSQSASDQPMAKLCEAIPHGLVGVTTVGAIRRLGYDVVITPGRGHHATVVIPAHLAETDAQALAALFEVRPNPLRSTP